MRIIAAGIVILVASACGASAAPSVPTPGTSSPIVSSSPPLSATATAPPPGVASTSIPLPNLGQVAAAGNGVVWMQVAGTHLYRSLDRGDTWSERTLPPQSAGGAIALVSDREGWLSVPIVAVTQCQVQAVQIWHTSDGAATWERLAATGIADAQCKGAVAFSDATHGYLTTQDPSTPPLVYRTTDGGKTWAASRPLPDPPGLSTQGAGMSLQAGPAADFGADLFLSARALPASGPRHYVYRSTDRGATWTYAGFAPRGDQVVFLTPTRWLQVISPEASQETTDAGGSWHAYPSDYQQAAPISPQIAFGDASVGYATVRGTLKRTIDGGLHWTSLKTPGT